MNDNLGLLDRLEKPEVGKDDADNLVGHAVVVVSSDQQSWTTNFLLRVWECLLRPLLSSSFAVMSLCRCWNV